MYSTYRRSTHLSTFLNLPESSKHNLRGTCLNAKSNLLDMHIHVMYNNYVILRVFDVSLYAHRIGHSTPHQSMSESAAGASTATATSPIRLPNLLQEEDSSLGALAEIPSARVDALSRWLMGSMPRAASALSEASTRPGTRGDPDFGFSVSRPISRDMRSAARQVEGAAGLSPPFLESRHGRRHAGC